MQNANKDIYSYSPDWTLDENSFTKETIKQHNGNSRDVYIYDVHKNKNTKLETNRPDFGSDLFLHEHKVIKLKTASSFMCDVVLRVHYNSYVTKGPERKRCFDKIPFRCGEMFYTQQFKTDICESFSVDNLSLKEFAQLYNTTPSIIKRIYSDTEIRNKLKPSNINKVSRIVVYEYHFDSEKKDCTIVFDVDTGLLLFAQEEQTGEQLKAFFEKYKNNLMSNIKEIYLTNNNQSYLDVIREEYPNIQIKYDLKDAIDIFVKNIITQINDN